MTEQAIRPLRRRMMEDMAIRKFAGKTQHDYVQRVKDFVSFLGRSPDTAQGPSALRSRVATSKNVRGARGVAPALTKAACIPPFA
jgi:hypothetical protein